MKRVGLTKQPLVKPDRLRPGDGIGIVAPALPIYDEETYSRGIGVLDQMGFRVEAGPNVRVRSGNERASADERAAELMDMFRRSDIKGILCLTGGGGSADLLPLLDYDTIRTHPTLFVGQSDITHLHMAMVSRAGLITLHGMELMGGFGAEEAHPAFRYNVDLFRGCCMSPEPLGTLPQRTPWECWRPGKAQGNLVGGFFAFVAEHAMRQYWPSFERIILFWEAVALEAGQIAERFRTLEQEGLFNNVAGMVVGKLVGPPTERESKALKADIRSQLLQITKSYGFPIIGNTDFGHDGSFMPLPEGLLASLDAEALDLRLLEAMVN